MTKKVFIPTEELEEAAEKAGGYVAAPGSLIANPDGEREFSAIRQYSIMHNKPISKFTDEDYRKIGIKR